MIRAALGKHVVRWAKKNVPPQVEENSDIQIK